MPPRRAATTLAAEGGLVGSASLLNIFLIGGTHTGSAAPMAPKAHDQTTIGSRCKKVVQNPAMYVCVRGEMFREKKSEERVAIKKTRERKRKKKEKKGKREIPPRSREIKREREEKKNRNRHFNKHVCPSFVG